MSAAPAAGNNGNGNRTPVDQHVEFVVKAAEDLILEGSERTIIRVRAGTPYSCLMLKNQRFSSLFRHYAKHHGLRKDDLAYYFTEELQNEDTPETVFLQGRDEIVVRKRHNNSSEGKDGDDEEVDVDKVCPNEQYMSNMAYLLNDADHTDVTFIVGEAGAEVKAHKCVLVARGEYFHSMFRKGSMAMREGSHPCPEVRVPDHDEPTFRRMLEFLYTNRVDDLSRCTADELIQLLAAANAFMLWELKLLCEHSARKIMDIATCAKLLAAAEQFNGEALKAACLVFIQKNMQEVCRHPQFEAETLAWPRLSITILQGISESQDGNGSGGSSAGGSKGPGSASGRSAKRRRVGADGGGGVGAGSLEVPANGPGHAL